LCTRSYEEGAHHVPRPVLHTSTVTPTPDCSPSLIRLYVIVQSHPTLPALFPLTRITVRKLTLNYLRPSQCFKGLRVSREGFFVVNPPLLLLNLYRCTGRNSEARKSPLGCPRQSALPQATPSPPRSILYISYYSDPHLFPPTLLCLPYHRQNKTWLGTLVLTFEIFLSLPWALMVYRCTDSTKSLHGGFGIVQLPTLLVSDPQTVLRAWSSET
jgi:hypothetical protein